jgi:hypothetical protein
MKESTIIWIAVVLLIATLCVVHLMNKPQGMWINCGIAEISPDYTNAIKEACRKARSDNDYRPK